MKEYIVRYEKDGCVAKISIFANTPLEAQFTFQASNSARIISIRKA